MNGKMKAVVKTERAAGAELLDLDIPVPGPGEVLVKVKATSICGTDVHIYTWNEWAQKRISHVPQTLGHEFAGEVVEVGSEVKRVKPGDLVSSETHIPCGKCPQCLTGQMHICNDLKILGVDVNGCFAEYAVVPEIVCWKNDPSIPFEHACVQEPLGNAVYATLEGGGVNGHTIAIFGEGPTGLFATGVARASGASEIFVVGKNRHRLEIAGRMGADHLLHVDETDAVEYIMEKTGGVGVDVVLEMSGAASAIASAFKVVRRGGRYTAFGIPSRDVTIDYANGVIFKGIRLYGITGRKMFQTWFEVRSFLASKRLDVSPVITHVMPLADYARGFGVLTSPEADCGKIVLTNN